MKKLAPFNAVIFIVFLLFSPILSAADFPAPLGYVNDFADLFSESFELELEADLAAFEQATTAEIAVVTVETLGDTYLEDYAVRLFEEWGIGKADKDNGALLLIAEQERAIRIEVGYGPEPVITDAAAGRIIREQMSPAFKAGDYEGGVKAAVSKIKSRITLPEKSAPSTPMTDWPSFLLPFSLFGLLIFASLVRKTIDPKNKGDELIAFFAMVLVVLVTSALFSVSLADRADQGKNFLFLGVAGVIFLSYLSAFWARSKRFWPGGVVGGGLGAFLGKFSGGTLETFLLALGLGFFGLFLDLILSANFKKLKKAGKPTGFWKSMGGFSGGGFGSRGGGGGFGGFGGGRSGGGGASGGW